MHTGLNFWRLIRLEIDEIYDRPSVLQISVKQ